MRFVANDPRDVEVTWYWAPPGARPAPYTIFASGNWSDLPTTPWLGPGEVKGAPRVWTNGKNLWGTTGQFHCGTDAAFATGLPRYPDPSEWHWCCCPWNSRPILSIQPPRSAEILLPGGYGSSAEPAGERVELGRFSLACLCLSPRSAELEEFRPGPYGSSGPAGPGPGPLPRFSLPCLCLSPRTAELVAPPATPYGSSAPRGSAPGPIVPWLSLACLCLRPSALAQLPTAGGPYGSSAPRGSAPGPIVPWLSLACLCLRPSALAQLPTAGGPYGSSARPRGSAERPALPWVSRACLCVRPDSLLHPQAPARSGPAASAAAEFRPIESKACLCLRPSSEAAFVPAIAGSGSAANPPLGIESKACLCLGPASSIEFPPLGPYQVQSGRTSSTTGSSGGGGGGNITVPCCADPMPLALLGTWSAITDPSIVFLNGATVHLTWNPASQFWSGDEVIQGVTYGVQFRCNLSGATWALSSLPQFFTAPQGATGTCGPVTLLLFTNVEIGLPAGGGMGNFTVSNS